MWFTPGSEHVSGYSLSLKLKSLLGIKAVLSQVWLYKERQSLVPVDESNTGLSPTRLGFVSHFIFGLE